MDAEPLETALAHPGTPGEALDRVIAILRSPPGTVILVLIGALCVLRIYYAARSAVSVRRDPRLGPPRGWLARWFARIRFDKLVAASRFEEAADLLQAMDPARGVEAAELYVKGKRYHRAAAILIANNRLRRAAETYVRAGAHDLAADLFERSEDLASAEENYVKAGNQLAAARMLARVGKAEKAARHFATADRPREAAEQLEKAGKKREAVEKYVEALAVLERADGLRVHPSERIVGAAKVVDALCEKILALFRELGDAEGQVDLLLERDRPVEAAQVLKSTGRMKDAARLLVEHDLVTEAVKVLDEAKAGLDTRRTVLDRA